ncbi:MAG: glycosyltransferase family 4 protein [Armatimonadetes bacterium]|nr:glycosyltransferase family 4 protein [Armatimonadota bacterium]
MLALVDVLLPDGHRSGVEHSVVEFVRALARLAPEEVGYACREALLASEPWLAGEQVLVAPRWATGRLGRIAAEQLWLAAAADRAGARLLHGPAYVLPLAWKGPSVVTVYDLIALLHPEWTKPANVLHYRLVLPRSIRKADMVIAPSMVVADEIAENLQRTGRIRVVHLGVREVFREPVEAAEVESFRASFRVERPYFAVVGNIEPKKNLRAVVRAFELVAPKLDHELVVVGRFGWRCEKDLQAMRESEVAGRIRFLGPLSDANLRACYAGSTALVQFSLYEGFGLTALEAMACGTAAIVSDGGALPEIAGPGAVTAPLEGGPEALAAAMTKLAEDARHRAEVVARGKQWSRRFTWAAHAEKVLQLYQMLVG